VVPPGKRQQLVIKFYKLLLQNNSAKPSCFLAVSPNVIKNGLHEHHCIVWRSIW